MTPIKTQLRFIELPRKLRVAAVTFAGILCANLILYGLLIAPTQARIREGETRYGELRQRHAQAVLFKKQKPSFD